MTRESRALDLEDGVFTWKDPKKIAESLRASAEKSTQRKMLEKAKDELRKLYGK